MLTDVQITDLAKRMSIPLEGVYFKDELPRKLKYNVSYVINLENSVDDEGKENDGSHWTCLQVQQYPDGKIEPMYFDPFGAPPSESIKKFVKDTCAKELPYNTKDIQSLMNNACGYYCLAYLHFINASQYRSRDLYTDAEQFLDMFDDLNTSVDWKKNEYILKHFFRSSDPTLRKVVEIDDITSQDEGKGINMAAIPCNINVRS